MRVPEGRSGRARAGARQGEGVVGAHLTDGGERREIGELGLNMGMGWMWMVG